MNTDASVRSDHRLTTTRSYPCWSVFCRGSFIRVDPCLSVAPVLVLIRVFPWFSSVFFRGHDTSSSPGMSAKSRGFSVQRAACWIIAQDRG